MVQQKFNERAHIFLTSAIAFLLPAYPDLLPPLIVLLTINWLCAPGLIIQGLKNISKNPSLLLMILLYVVYIIGMLYTTNTKDGSQTIETKLSFLVFPLVFSPYAQTCKINLNKYLKFFIYGSLVSALVRFGWAFYCFIKPVYVVLYGVPYDLGASYFYYTQLSVFFHPSYLALYYLFALIALVHLVTIGELKYNWKWVLAIFLLALFILLLTSKAGWIGLLLFTLYFSRLLILNKKIAQAVAMFGLLIGLFYFLNIYFTPRFLTRIPKLSVITEAIKGSDNENKKITTSTDGSGSRVLVWKAAVEIIENNFLFGVGTGDAKDTMLEKYKEKEMTYEFENKLNSHNQYLNTFIALGVIGFSILLLCFAVPFYFSYREKVFLFAAFIIIVGFNFLVESMLERQEGVIFYAFFYSILSFSLSYNNPNSLIENPKTL